MDSYLINATNEILNYLKEIPLSDSAVRYYESCYRTIIAYCQSKGKAFSFQTAKEFLSFYETRNLEGEITKVYYLNMRKSAYTLAEYLEGKPISWTRRNYNQSNLCSNFAKVLNEFKHSLSTTSLADGSITLLWQMIKRFLVFLETKSIYKLSDVQLNHVKEFIIKLAPSHRGSMINLTWSIKRFFMFLSANNYTNLNVKSLLANPISARKKVLPCFSQGELDDIFSVVDTSTVIGKRDYAIMKIAIGTGLRAVDIVNLCFSDIDWRKNEITIIQQKTGSCLTIPLSPDVGNAIVDYILNGRPNVNTPYIFLRIKQPYGKLRREGTGSNMIKRYLSKLNISHVVGDGKTFHAFRRTFGTKLIEAKVPLATTAQMLGHTSIDSSKRYIALNHEMLRICCMDISKYATTKEGLL